MLPNPNYYYCSKCGADHRTGSPCPQVGAPKEDVEIMNDLPPLEKVRRMPGSGRYK